MSPGQELAVEQLRAIEEADATVFEIIRTVPPSKESPLLTCVVSLNCRGLERVAEGLPLREREGFSILVPPDFPFSIPHIWATHERFAGKPHVQWKRHLCIYQSPQTEWDSSDGMFGFIERLSAC